ncbi:glucosamine-6-phosphate deaminase [bacterium]|nr:glucosamine-6-phosphate deaminase [bacterium]
MSGRIKLLICEDAKSTSSVVAQYFADAMVQNPNIVLGLATGGTPVPVYEKLVSKYRAGDLSFSEVTTFNLDEYVGLNPEHCQSYRYFMQENLFDHVDISEKQTHVPDGVAEDLKSGCLHYEAAIDRAGGIDLQLLGIGENGHIAFNEPGASASSRTSVVDLTKETIAANSRFFEAIGDVPKTAVTMGIGTILESKSIVLMATGENKATALARALDSNPGPDSPASYLSQARDVTFIIDRSASQHLSDETLKKADCI